MGSLSRWRPDELQATDSEHSRNTGDVTKETLGRAHRMVRQFPPLWNLTSSRVRASGPLAGHTKCEAVLVHE